jgi:NAD(P)H-hydrate epimerase
MSESIVRLTRAQVREVDRRAIEQYHVPGIVLMENAARGAAEVAWEMLGGTPADVQIVCGGGNNGGDGLAIARHLHNRGCRVTLLLATDPTLYRGDALLNWRIVETMSLSVLPADPAQLDAPSDLIIDALFGTGLSKPITGPVADVIARVNQRGTPILAVDLPSGLDCDTGQPLGPACVRATRTVTFVAEKAGFANPAARQYTGPITVADIGCPKQIIDDVLRDGRL